MAVKIEKNIPAPKLRKRAFGKKRKEFSGKYKWWLMKPGNSFFVKKKKEQTMNSFHAQISSLANLIIKNNKLNWVFTTQRNHKKNGVRVWRVK